MALLPTDSLPTTDALPRMAPRGNLTRVIRRLAVALTVFVALLVMVGPLAVIISGSFTTTSYVTFPPHGFTGHWYQEAFSDPAMIASLIRSLSVAFSAATVATSLALALGIGLDGLRTRFGRRTRHSVVSAVRSYALLAMMIPAVVIGIALLVYLTRINVISQPYSLVLAYVAHFFPFAFLMVEVGLANAPETLRRSAQILGASPRQVLRHITAPLAAPGIAAGFAIVFVLSFSEVTIAVFMQQPGTVTLPVYLFNKLYAQPPTLDLTAMSSAVTLATVVAIAVVTMLASRRPSGKTAGR